MGMIPIQAKITHINGLISRPWIAFFKLIVDKYDPSLTIQLATKATANVYNLSATESGSIISNFGCSALQTVNMPAAVTGLEFRVNRCVAFAIRMVPASTEIIVGASAADKYLSLDDTGSSCYLICVNPGTWQVLSSHGTLSFQP